MVFAAFWELELLEFGLPTDEAQKVLWVYEEVEEGLGLGQEYILNLCAYDCLEICIRRVGNR